ncbi:unnamed protein product, partial [Vitis vinifera]
MRVNGKKLGAPSVGNTPIMLSSYVVLPTRRVVVPTCVIPATTIPTVLTTFIGHFPRKKN